MGVWWTLAWLCRFRDPSQQTTTIDVRLPVIRDGPGIKKGFYPVDLTSPGTQARTDGYLYAYIQYGGIVMMPSYRESISSNQAWNVVNYVRKLQGKLTATEETSQ